MTQFTDFGLAEPILRALAEEKYETPTPIQSQTIPTALAGRDVIGIAQTGTGKTAAFALPILHHLTTKRLRPEKKSCRVLVLSPTRELSGQISDSFRAYGRHIKPLAVALAIGGVPINRQVRSLAHGVEVLVATPGRLLDLVNQRAVTLNQVEVLVLDEADRMLDMGFIHDIKRVVAMLRKERQTLFFSATMPQEITKLADSMLNDPVRVAVTPQASTVDRIAQRVIHTEKSAKPSLLIDVLKSETTDRVLVFTRTKHGADKVVKGLEKNGFLSAAIHGNKSQNQRERVLADFKSGKLRILIATDIAARGIDVDGVSHVINYDLPNVPESYVHRIGRTARAGAEGIAISFCDQEEGVFLRDIERMIRITIPASGEKQPHQPAVRNSGNRGQGGRPQNGGGRNQGRGNGGGGGNGRSGQNGHRAHGGGNGGGNGGRPSHQSGHQKGHAQAARQDTSSGEPNDIGTVTFLQRSGEPRRNAGHRTR